VVQLCTYEPTLRGARAGPAWSFVPAGAVARLIAPSLRVCLDS
jgi:hypothetical protein